MPESADCEIWPDNWDVVQAFLRCATQWRIAGMAGTRTGLDYAGVAAVLRLTVPAARRQEIFLGIQVMELTALQVWAQEAERRRPQK